MKTTVFAIRIVGGVAIVWMVWIFRAQRLTIMKDLGILGSIMIYIYIYIYWSEHGICK